MKNKIKLCFILLAFSLGSAFAENKTDNAVAKGLRNAAKEYQEGNISATSKQLKELIKILEEKNASRVSTLLPEEIGDWKGTKIEREDLSLLGGGVCLERQYSKKSKSLTIKLVKDSPVADLWLNFLGDRKNLKAIGKPVHTINGEFALVESDLKIMMSVNGKIFLEINGDNDCVTSDLIDFARDLDIRTMKGLQ